MKFVVTCALVVVISCVVHSQEEGSTEATPSNDGGEVKPETTDRGVTKPRSMCPSLIKFLTDRGFNFSGRRPSSRNLPDDFNMFRFSPSNYNPSNLSPPNNNPSNFNPSNFNPSNYNPNFFGRRSWNPQGRREGSRGGFGGPNFDTPNRDDVEFL